MPWHSWKRGEGDTWDPIAKAGRACGDKCVSVNLTVLKLQACYTLIGKLANLMVMGLIIRPLASSSEICALIDLPQTWMICLQVPLINTASVTFEFGELLPSDTAKSIRLL